MRPKAKLLLLCVLLFGAARDDAQLLRLQKQGTDENRISIDLFDRWVLDMY